LKGSSVAVMSTTPIVKYHHLRYRGSSGMMISFRLPESEQQKMLL
jgi:hypothetical protein